MKHASEILYLVSNTSEARFLRLWRGLELQRQPQAAARLIRPPQCSATALSHPYWVKMLNVRQQPGLRPGLRRLPVPATTTSRSPHSAKKRPGVLSRPQVCGTHKIRCIWGSACYGAVRADIPASTTTRCCRCCLLRQQPRLPLLQAHGLPCQGGAGLDAQSFT